VTPFLSSVLLGWSRSITIAPVTTISFKLPAALAARLAAQARARQKSKSALVRDYLERGLESAATRSPTFHDLAGDQCGIGRSQCRDLATNPRHLDDYGR